MFNTVKNARNKKKRYIGLNTFNILLKTVSIEDIINKSFELYKDLKDSTLKVYSTEWEYYRWVFGNTWRNFIHERDNNKIDIAATFPLCVVLTDKQLYYIKKTLNISTDYKVEKYN